MTFKYLTIAIGIIISLPSFAQDENLTTVTAAEQQQIKLNIEKEVTKIRPRIQKNYNMAEAEFYLDTLRIDRFRSRMLEKDYNNLGMQSINYQAAKMYDSLLNKYYKKLTTLLKGDDKKVLQQAQKAWLAFRDAENTLTGIMSKDEYSGGGSIQGLINSGMYLERIRKRVEELFEHYQRTQPVE